MPNARTQIPSDVPDVVRWVAALVGISLVIVAGRFGADALQARKTVIFLSPWSGQAMHYANAVKLGVMFGILAVACGYGAMRPQRVIDVWGRLGGGRR
jgi:hypothetical protein